MLNSHTEPTARKRPRRRLALIGVSLCALMLVALAVFVLRPWQGPTNTHLSDNISLFRRGFSHQALPLATLALNASRRSQVALAGANAARELAGSGDNSVVSWNPNNGLWARPYHPNNVGPKWRAPIWWQSAVDLIDLDKYLQVTSTQQPAYEELITRTYRMGIHMPGSDSPYGFANQFLDDTGWWGIAWLQTALYELSVRHSVAEARRYMHVAEYDANYVFRAPRTCGGIAWQLDYSADTTSNAEFTALAAQLARELNRPGPLYNPRAAQRFLTEAKRTLRWMVSTKLIDMGAGRVSDQLNGHCRPEGAPMTYTQGETADALVQLGLATGNTTYYHEAGPFLNRVLYRTPSMMDHGVLQQGCERARSMCVRMLHAYDAEAYKGIFVNAVSDFIQATGTFKYAPFLLAQAHAVMVNAASDGVGRTSCTASPHDCQIGFYWARRIPPAQWPILAAPGSQASGLAALTAAVDLGNRANLQAKNVIAAIPRLMPRHAGPVTA